MLGKLKEEHIENETIVRGYLRTYSLALDFQLEPNPDKGGEKAPSHIIMAKSPKHGGKFCAGGAWQGNHTEHGRYFSLSFEVPEMFKEPLRCIAGETGTFNGEYVIKSNRDKEEKQAA